MSSVDYDVVVVGAGLCGLSIAHLLENRNLQVLVLESRAKPGGRIRSLRDSQTQEVLGDLGPTWVWPSAQPVLQRWLEKLGVSTVAQYTSESPLIESSPQTAPQLQPVPVQESVYRVDGGSSRLVDELSNSLAKSSIRVGEHVTQIDTSEACVLVHSSSGASPVKARQVVLAMPPRIVQQGIRFSPALDQEFTEELKNAPTWMATQAKIVLLYSHAFWREQPHGGRVFSKIGPIGELQDHSGPAGDPAALTGFLAWPHELRRNADDELKSAIQAQLKRLFGADAPEPLQLVVKDWAQDHLAATPHDLNESPRVRTLLPAFLRDTRLNGRVWLSGAELAPQSPGLIEGAFASAEHTVKRVLQSLEDKSLA